MKPLKIFTVGVVLGVMLGTGVGSAAIPDSVSGIISSCVRIRDGAIRLIDAQVGQTCKSGERLISWGQTGPQGERGLPGSDGPSLAVLDASGDVVGSFVTSTGGGGLVLVSGDGPLAVYANGLPQAAGDAVFAQSDCEGVPYVAVNLLETWSAQFAPFGIPFVVVTEVSNTDTPVAYRVEVTGTEQVISRRSFLASSGSTGSPATQCVNVEPEQPVDSLTVVPISETSSVPPFNGPLSVGELP